MANIPGFAIRHGGAVAFIDMASAPGVGAKKLTEPGPKDDYSSSDFSPWGTNNQFPQEMIADIETCGILNSIIDGKARFALCDGIVPAIVERDANGKKVVKKWVDDPEITAFLEMNNHFIQTFGWMKDLLAFANGAVQFMLNGKRDKIVSFKRTDISKVRVQKKLPENNFESKVAWISSNWDKITKAEGNKQAKTLPLLDPNNPVEDLRRKANNGSGEHMMVFNYPSWGKDYYPVPLWYAAYKWVKIAQGVPEMKAALFQNTMRLKYKVTIFPEYWTGAYPDQWDTFTSEQKETKRQEVFTEIANYLVGSENAHKSIFVDGHRHVTDGKESSSIHIEEIPDNTKPGEYLPDSAAANSEIAFSMLFNPSIIGANLPDGPYAGNEGGSSVRESALMQVIIHELERKMIGRVMNVIKYFNEWDKKHPGLEFIIPATALTTLDTGAGSKPILTGGAQPKKEKTDGTDNNNS